MNRSPVARLPVELWHYIVLLVRNAPPRPSRYSTYGFSTTSTNSQNSLSDLTETCKYFYSVAGPLRSWSYDGDYQANPEDWETFMSTPRETLKYFHDVSLANIAPSHYGHISTLENVRSLQLWDIVVTQSLADALASLKRLDELLLGWIWNDPERSGTIEWSPLSFSVLGLRVYTNILDDMTHILDSLSPRITVLDVSDSMTKPLYKAADRGTISLASVRRLLLKAHYGEEPSVSALERLACHIPNLKSLLRDDEDVCRIERLPPCAPGTFPCLRRVGGEWWSLAAFSGREDIECVEMLGMRDENIPKLSFPKAKKLFCGATSWTTKTIGLINASFNSLEVLKMPIKDIRVEFMQWMRDHLEDTLGSMPRLQVLWLFDGDTELFEDEYNPPEMDEVPESRYQRERDMLVRIKGQKCKDIYEARIAVNSVWIHFPRDGWNTVPAWAWNDRDND